MNYSNLFRRILAYLIDCLLAFLLFVVIIQFAIFVPLRQFVSITNDWFASGWKTELYTVLTISLPIWLYFIIFEVSPWKATIGKRILGLQTLDAVSKRKITIFQAILRTIIKLLPWEIAHFTNNIPIPMWYDNNPQLRPGFLIVPILVVVYLVVIQLTYNHQGIHDLIAKTIVTQKKS